VYPWVGLLRGGRGGDEPIRVMDRCRVRWGQVVTTSGATAVVRSRPLAWDGWRLTLAAPVEETAVLRLGDRGLVGPVRPGDWCSLHWDWVCERLDGWQVAALRRRTLDQLAVVNGTAACLS
jgi:hypothetical protein